MAIHKIIGRWFNIYEEEVALIWFTLQTTLRVLAAQDRSGQMNRIADSIFSTDQLQRDNSLEAMGYILDKNLVRVLMPLLEHMDAAERIAVGRRLFPDDVREQSTPDLFQSLLESRNRVTPAFGAHHDAAVGNLAANPHPNRDLGRVPQPLCSAGDRTTNGREAGPAPEWRMKWKRQLRFP